MEENHGLVCIVTVNWNQAVDTLECLESLKKLTYPNLLTIVVDNGSEDGSLDLIAEQYPEVDLVRNPTNLGFGGGYNRGMQRALERGADYVFIVNNDTLIDPECITRLMEHAAPEVGILSPLIYYTQEPKRIWAAGGPINAWNLERHDPHKDQMDDFEWPEVLEQDFVTSCAMLVPRSFVETIGGFDERYFFYYEDSDICLRARRAGRRGCTVPKAKLWHKVSRSSGGAYSPRERYWMARSGIRFFRKFARPQQIPVIVFWRTGSAMRMSLRLLRMGKTDALKAYWKGLREGLSNSL